MQTIWEFPLQVIDVQPVTLPAGAEILCVQIQHGQPMLWAKVDPDAEKGERFIITHGTGHPVEDDLTYIGSYQQLEGALVFHVFEAVEP